MFGSSADAPARAIAVPPRGVLWPQKVCGPLLCSQVVRARLAEFATTLHTSILSHNHGIKYSVGTSYWHGVSFEKYPAQTDTTYTGQVSQPRVNRRLRLVPP